MVGNYPHQGSVKWYLKTPRTVGADKKKEFTYEKVAVLGNNKRYPIAEKWAWEIKYKGESICIKDTVQQAREFIMEKLEN